MIEHRLDGPTGEVDLDNIIGAKVIVKSLTMCNGFGWNRKNNEMFTVSNVNFRISLDGKCHTIILLSEIPDRKFTLKDLIFIKLDENEKSSE